jgi:hypothetical protein
MPRLSEVGQERILSTIRPDHLLDAGHYRRLLLLGLLRSQVESFP